MKKLLFLFAFLVAGLTTISAKTLPAPGTGIYVLVDTNYTVSTSLFPTTKASLYYTNSTATLVTGMQFRVFYDKDLLEFKGINTDEKPMTWLSFLNANDGVVEWGGIDMSNNKFNLKNNEQIITLQFLAKKPKDEWSVSPLYVS